MEEELFFAQRPPQHRLVEVIQIKNADLASQLRDVLDQFVGLSFSNSKEIFLAAILFEKIDKRLHRKGIVLSGDAEEPLDGGGSHVSLLDEIRLFDDLPCVSQKLFPFGR